MKRIFVVGTADTKGPELDFIRSAVSGAGAIPVVVDVGSRSPTIAVEVSAEEVARHHPHGAAAITGGQDRGEAMAAMTEAFRRFAPTLSGLDGVLGIGGSCGTSIITAGMRELATGVPKVMVSTLASGNVAAFVGVSDIAMMPAITDLGGLNDITRGVLSRAAAAVVAMAKAPPVARSGRRAIGLTMFGVTTPAVTRIVAGLGAGRDCLVFHATGVGGRTMEKLAADGELAGLIDITTTEICDLLFGGVLPATEQRLDVVAQTGLPYVGSVGALDMINFGAPDTVPPTWSSRLSYRHNPDITLVRTTAEECRRLGRWIGAKLDRCDGPVRFLIPEGGVSALDAPGQPFFDPEADAALFEAIETSVRWTERRRLIRLPCHINDPAFADAAVSQWLVIAGDDGPPTNGDRTH